MAHDARSTSTGWRLGPRTPRGRRAAWFGTASLLLFFAFSLLVASGQRGGDTFVSNPWLSGAISAAAICALLGAGYGLVATAKDGERSAAILAVILLGVVVLLFVVAEVTFPH